MGPFDYTRAFDDVGPAYEAAVSGLKNGLGIRQAETERAAAEAKLAQQKQMQLDLAALSANPTADAIAQASLKYPQLSEPFKRSFDMLEPAKRQAKLSHASQVYAAIQNGKPEIAQELLSRQAAAYRNSGDEAEAKAAETWAALIKDHPDTARLNAGVLLASAMGPDKFTEAFGKIGALQFAGELQGDLVRKGKAEADKASSDAQTASVEAKFAERNALADLEKKGWDIKAIQSDIDFKKNQTKIGYLTAQLAKERNGLDRQRLQLDLDKAVQERDDKLRAKVADVESAALNIDNMLNTIERIKKNPRLDAVLGSIEGRTPAITDDGSDAIALIETLGSQAFLSQIPNIKGMGALSNAEGEKLQAAFQNLSRVQSEKQFRATLEEAARLLNKGRATVSKRYGVPLGAPDTPAAAAGDKPPIDSFFR